MHGLQRELRPRGWSIYPVSWAFASLRISLALAFWPRQAVQPVGFLWPVRCLAGLAFIALFVLWERLIWRPLDR